jgi:hypothetical protein
MSTPPDLTNLAADVAALKAALAAKEHHTWAWIKANAGHYVTWIMLGYQIVKHL